MSQNVQNKRKKVPEKVSRSPCWIVWSRKEDLLRALLQKAALQFFWELGLRAFKAVKELELFASRRPIGEKKPQLYSVQQCCTRLSARINCC